MPELDWPRALLVAVVVLGLFFGASYLYGNHIRKGPFLERLSALEGVASAEVISGGGSERLLITPEPSYRGLLEDLFTAAAKEAAASYRKPLPLEIADQRSSRLDQFAAAASPALHEAARTGRYREAAAVIDALAAESGLTDCHFTVDHRQIYLQARDGACYLYRIVPLPPFEEGEAADA